MIWLDEVPGSVSPRRFAASSRNGATEEIDTEEPADLLLDLLASQLPAGGFRFRESWADNFGIDPTDFFDQLANLKTKERQDRVDILATAVVFAILEVHFADRRSEWEQVVAKSRTWLAEQIKDGEPPIDGVPLTEWARSYVERLVPGEDTRQSP